MTYDVKKKHMKNDDNPWKNDISENHMKKLEDVWSKILVLDTGKEVEILVSWGISGDISGDKCNGFEIFLRNLWLWRS